MGHAQMLVYYHVLKVLAARKNLTGTTIRRKDDACRSTTADAKAMPTTSRLKTPVNNPVALCLSSLVDTEFILNNSFYFPFI